jgi:hypothetical protein
MIGHEVLDMSMMYSVSSKKIKKFRIFAKKTPNMFS